MLLSIQAYRVYISSVLQFVLQLEPLPDNFKGAETKAVQALLPGPMAWMVPTCMKDAKYMGLHDALLDLEAVAHASKLRVATWENLEHQGSGWRSVYVVSTMFPHTTARYSTWAGFRPGPNTAFCTT